MTLQLILTVDYKPNGVSEQELSDLLWYLAWRAVNDGYLTGETPAEVDRWSINVKKL